MTLASVHNVGWLLVHSVWQFTAIALLLAVVLRVLRRAPAGVRYTAALIGWAMMLAAPIATWCVLPAATRVVAQVEPIEAAAAEPPAPIPSQDELNVDWPPTTLVAPSPKVETHAAIPVVDLPVADWTQLVSTAIAPWLNTLVVIWCVGVCLFAARSARGWYVVQSLLRRDVVAAPDEMTSLLVSVLKRVGLKHRVRLLQSPHVGVPIVVGWLRPVILLPVCVATGFSPQQLEAVLAHELAHIRRHDYLINLLQTLSETVFFYHPALWWASAILRREREHCCDELAAQALGNRAEYGRALLALEELRGTTPAMALGAKGGSLLERIRRLAQLEPTPRFGAGGVIAIAVVAALLVTAAVWGANVGGAREDGADTTTDQEAGAETESDYTTAVADKFASAAAELQEPFLGEAEIAALQEELHAYLAARISRDPSDENRQLALNAIGARLTQICQWEDPYLRFDYEFDMLCWQLWVLAERRELTPAELTTREEQREWMRDYIRNLPQSANQDRREEYRHAGRLALLETRVFNNALSPFLHEPMSNPEFAEFQRLFAERNGGDASNKLTFAPAHIHWAAARACYRPWLERYPPGFPTGLFSTNDEDEFHFHKRSHNVGGGFLGSGTEFVLDGTPRQIFRAQSDEASSLEQPPEVDLVFRTQDTGRPVFGARNGTFVAVNGARLATLDTSEWHVADRIPLAEIRARIASAPLESFQLFDDDNVPELGYSAMKTATDRLPILAVETAEGTVATIRITPAAPEGRHATIRLRPLEPNPPFHSGDVIAQVEHEVDQANDAPIDLTIIQTQHVLLLEGKQIVTWEEIDQKIAALPDPSRMTPQLYVTRGATEAGLWDTAWAKVGELSRKYMMNGQSVGSLTPRTDFHYDRIKTPADLVPDPSLRRDGTVVMNGKPVAGAEVILITPVDESLPYKAYDIYLVSGRVRNPFDEVLTRTDEAGRFSVYPPANTPFSLLALHPDVGIALMDGDQFAKQPLLTLLGWGGIAAEFSKEPEQQSADPSTRLEASDLRPEITLTQYWEDLNHPEPTLTFAFTHVPPIWPASIQRSFPRPDGGSSSVPGASLSVMPGETQSITLGPVTKQQRERLQWMRERFGGQAQAAPVEEEGVAAAGETASGQGATTSTERAADAPAQPAEPMTTLIGTVVDEMGRPIAGALLESQFYSHGQRERATATTNAEGRFELPVPTDEIDGLPVTAASADGGRMGIVQIPWEQDVGQPSELKLTLKSAQSVQVVVVDADGRPVPEALATFVLNWSHVVTARTDENGKARFQLPADAEIHSLHAAKNGLGLDYKAYFSVDRLRAKQPQERPPLSQPIVLALTGVKPLTVTLLDAENDQPIPDTRVYLWYLKKPGEADDLNISGFVDELGASTDRNGQATFDWLPAWSENQSLTVWTSAENHDRQRGTIKLAHGVVPVPSSRPSSRRSAPGWQFLRGDGELTMRLDRLVPLSGRVTLPDGSPAPGIKLEVAGDGYTDDNFREHVTTGADGRYSINVSPKQTYIVVVQDRKWAAPPATGFVVLPGQAKTDVDFTLQPATRVFGRITLGTDQHPVVGQEVHIVQWGDELSTIDDSGLKAPPDDRQVVRPRASVFTKTDADGRYEFFVGPGRFELSGPAQDQISDPARGRPGPFTVTTETERRFDFHMGRPAEGRLSGVVMSGSPPQPVADATVYCIHRGRQSGRLKFAAGDDGRFEIIRPLSDATLYATSSDGASAGVLTIGPDDDSATIEIRPVASARGRLLDATTKEPLKNVELVFSLNLDGSTHYEDGKIQFGGTVTTDDQGAFTLQSLAPGAEFELLRVINRDADGLVRSRQRLTVVRADKPGEVVELGDLLVEPVPDPVASAEPAPPVDLNEVRAAVKPWLDDAFQIDDAARRDAAIEQVRAALASQDLSEQRKGLVAFTAMAEIQFDKAACHDLIVPLLSSAAADVRALAAQSLVISGIRDGDLERLNTLAGDSNSHAREQAAFPIVTAAQRDLTGAPAKDAILKLLNDSEESVRTETIHSLWGAKLSPEIEARIIEISRKQSQFSDGEPYQALYYALSTQANKSEASVKRLIEYLAHTDTLNVAGRAAWGLGAGVAPEQRSLVADAMLKVLSARSTGHLSNEALARLKQYAGAEQADGIRTLREKPGIDTKLRTELEAIAASLPEGR